MLFGDQQNERIISSRVRSIWTKYIFNFQNVVSVDNRKMFKETTEDPPKLKNPLGGFVSPAQRQTIPSSIHAICVRESSRQL